MYVAMGAVVVLAALAFLPDMFTKKTKAQEGNDKANEEETK